MFHPNPKEFLTSNVQFGPLGAVVVQLSNLEFAHDQFVLKFFEKFRQTSLEIASSFPRQFKDKTDFLIEAVLRCEVLRTVPIFDTGELNLQWLQYQLDELYEIRAVLAHGSISYSEEHEDGILWRFERVTSPNKNQWQTSSTTMGSSFLAGIHETSKFIRLYLRNLENAPEGKFSWEEIYKQDLQIRENNQLMTSLITEGRLQSGWLHASMSEVGGTVDGF